MSLIQIFKTITDGLCILHLSFAYNRSNFFLRNLLTLWFIICQCLIKITKFQDFGLLNFRFPKKKFCIELFSDICKQFFSFAHIFFSLLCFLTESTSKKQRKKLHVTWQLLEIFTSDFRHECFKSSDR